MYKNYFKKLNSFTKKKNNQKTKLQFYLRKYVYE